MILFVLGFLWIPSVLGDCSSEAGNCQDGTCSDSCYIWRGPNKVDTSLHYCSGDDVSDFIKPEGKSCEEVLGRPDYAEDNWIYFGSSTPLGDVCNIGPWTAMGRICKCNEPCGNQPKPKSKLSTEAIIGITLGTLLIISIIAYIFRKQLPFRFAKQTGQQLIQ